MSCINAWVFFQWIWCLPLSFLIFCFIILFLFLKRRQKHHICILMILQNTSAQTQVRYISLRQLQAEQPVRLSQVGLKKFNIKEILFWIFNIKYYNKYIFFYLVLNDLSLTYCLIRIVLLSRGLFCIGILHVYSDLHIRLHVFNVLLFVKLH